MNYLVELTFILYGFFLITQAQYLTCLILLILSFILVIKGFNYNTSIIFTIIFLLFLTQYHRFFPYRDNDTTNINNISRNDIDTNNISRNDIDTNNEIEGFKSKSELKIIDSKIKKSEKRKKIRQKRLLEENKKYYSNYPRRYIKNKLKIEKKSPNWGASLRKWSLLKENLFILLNT
jgi:hypothetical protein